MVATVTRPHCVSFLPAPQPIWHAIMGVPERVREVERCCIEAEHPTSWVTREGAMWELEIFCTVEEADAIDAACQYEIAAATLPRKLPVCR